MVPSRTCAGAAAALLAGLACTAVPAERGSSVKLDGWSQACAAEGAPQAGLIQVRQHKLPKKQLTFGASSINASARTGTNKIGSVCTADGQCASNRCAGNSNGGQGTCQAFGGGVTITLTDNSGCASDGQTDVKNAFTSAAQTYSRVLRGQWIDPSLDLEVNIVWSIETMDGASGLLGSAGPQTIYVYNLPGYAGARTLPSTGIMRFDIDDLGAGGSYASLATQVILHEMGHVLGLGTLWALGSTLGSSYFSFIDCNCEGTLTVASGYYFTPDRYASTAYQRSGGYLPSGFTSFDQTPPIETAQGSCGTLCGHWAEGVLLSEVMTGFATGATEFSSITIGAFEDLGYTVDYTQAEEYTVPPEGTIGRHARGLEYEAQMIQPDLSFSPSGAPNFIETASSNMEEAWNRITARIKSIRLRGWWRGRSNRTEWLGRPHPGHS